MDEHRQAPAVDTPADVAQREAAKQAVALAFAIAGGLAMIPIYKRIARTQADALRSVLPHDPALRELEQKQADAAAAAAAVRRQVRQWHRLAGLLWPVSSSAAMWALRRAESVSKRTSREASR